MGMFGGLFRVPDHRKYNYHPRHFDPDKEAFEERIAAAKMMAEDTPEAAKMRISKGLRRGSYNPDTQSMKRKAVITTGIRMLLIIIVLIAFMALFVDVYIDEILEFIG